jgi:hypothetical protein
MGQLSDRDDFFLDVAERDLVARAFAAVGERMPDQRVALEGVLSRLRKTAELIRDSPSLSSSWSGLSGRTFSAGSLVEVLCRVSDYDLDLHIPTKAVLGQAYLIAKINFFKATRYTLDALDVPPELGQNLEVEIGQSIYTKLAEELFVSIVTDPSASLQVKLGAARFLFHIWEERLLIEVDDFAPVLDAAWQARSKLLPVLGTMLGTHEVFRLFQEARDHRFLDYFGEEDVEEEALLAFEEFLFGLSHEEIGRLRSRMTLEGKSCVSLDEARALLGNAAAPWTPQWGGAQALYSSYKKRRVNAAHRALTGSSGPKRTAEEYVLISFLHAGASPSAPALKVAPHGPP